MTPEEHFRAFMESFSVDVHSEHFAETPRRVTEMYREILSGYKDPDFKFTTFSAPPQPSLVIVKDIDYHSLCSHHMMPFFGKMTIGYLPKTKICGLSKLVRTTRHFAAKLQVQEILTNEVADFLIKELEPEALAVVVNGRHMCMEMRGVRSACSSTITSAMRGLFITDAGLKSEFIELLKVG